MSQRKHRGPAKRGGGAPHRYSMPVRDGEEMQGSERSKLAICNILEGTCCLQTPAPWPSCHLSLCAIAIGCGSMLGCFHLVSGLCPPRAQGVPGETGSLGREPLSQDGAERSPLCWLAGWLSSPTAAPATWITPGGHCTLGPRVKIGLCHC